MTLESSERDFHKIINILRHHEKSPLPRRTAMENVPIDDLPSGKLTLVCNYGWNHYLKKY